MKNHWLKTYDDNKFFETVFVQCTNFGFTIPTPDIDLSGLVFEIDTTSADDSAIEIIFTETTQSS